MYTIYFKYTTPLENAYSRMWRLFVIKHFYLLVFIFRIKHIYIHFHGRTKRQGKKMEIYILKVIITRYSSVLIEYFIATPAYVPSKFLLSGRSNYRQSCVQINFRKQIIIILDDKSQICRLRVTVLSYWFSGTRVFVFVISI